MSWTPEEIEQTLRAVTERSLKDSAFRALAISNPNAAIAQVTNKAIPADFRIQFVDNAGNDMTIVLPDAKKDAPAAINEEELAGVAGGAGYGYGPSFLCNVPTVSGCPPPPSANCTHDNLTACNPGYTKKPGSPAFCPA